MKKLLLVLVLICLWGCTQNKNTKTKQDTPQQEMSQQEEKQESEKVKELMAGIQKTMPQEIYQELEKNKVVSETDGTILIGNDKDEPSLRLDFTYENGKIRFW